MKFNIEFRCILCPLIILEMFLHFNWSQSVESIGDWR